MLGGKGLPQRLQVDVASFVRMWSGLTPIPNTHAGMPRKPEPPQLAKWSIYRAAKKAVRLGEVEADNEHEAIEKAAKEFRTDASKLIAVRRQ
jgi:hypothetical protein